MPLAVHIGYAKCATSFLQSLVFPKLDGAHYNEAKQLFSAYLLFDDIRGVMNDQKKMGSLATDMRLSMQDLKKLGRVGIDITLYYIKDNVSLNKFLPR